jgi:hypothetical protein
MTKKELEKENAELKGIKDVATLIRANNDTVTTLMQLNNKLVSKSQQLTKAKDLFLRFIDLKNKPCASGHSINMLLYENICDDVKQFLGEVEK